LVENANSKKESKEEWIRFRVDPEMKNNWLALCQKRGESEAELGRKLIAKAIAQEGVQDGLDEIISILRMHLKDILKPTEERLAAINAKTGIAAATSMYLNTQVIANAGQDALKIHEDARKKAVAYMKATKKNE
jgi:hypothetical protein